MQDGTVVAVKVQHKFVKRHSFVDVYTMDFLVRTVKFFFPQFEFMWLADIVNNKAENDEVQALKLRFSEVD